MVNRIQFLFSGSSCPVDLICKAILRNMLHQRSLWRWGQGSRGLKGLDPIFLVVSGECAGALASLTLKIPPLASGVCLFALGLVTLLGLCSGRCLLSWGAESPNFPPTVPFLVFYTWLWNPCSLVSLLPTVGLNGAAGHSCLGQESAATFSLKKSISCHSSCGPGECRVLLFSSWHMPKLIQQWRRDRFESRNDSGPQFRFYYIPPWGFGKATIVLIKTREYINTSRT